MTRTRTTRRSVRKTKTKTELSPRAVLLAGLGAVSLCRKQALKSVDGLATGADDLRSRAEAAAREAGNRVAKFRKQAKTRIAPVQKQAAQFAQLAQAEFEARFAPVLVKLGAKAPARKRTARTAKRTTRPAARRSRKRA
ncbi:hypothetical protein [Arenimonas daejeonensis]|uniref:hypothetical protein n=1 Tax=Arenimonas daejeonensis TaxID=370777 RepID=UPI0011BFDF44|nr:hypothetical protein [Arenimonas daejeonensis]